MTGVVAGRSPWEAALGDSVAVLHPRLIAYFGAIADGMIGRGTGTFDRVGTPRRWLWPVLWLLGLDGIVFPVWASDVPFTVENRRDGEVLRAERVFQLPGRTRVMTDSISFDQGSIIDRLGRHGRFEARLSARVVDGALVLRSTSTSLRLGRLRMPVPFAPRVELREQSAGDRQRVTLVMSAPFLGRIYEYAGEFDYAVVPQ